MPDKVTHWTPERSFHLGDVLSITTGRLVSPRHIEGVYDILNFIFGTDHFTHQLGRASETAKPWILQQHPALVAVDVSTCNSECWQGWLTMQIAVHGEYLPIKAIPGEFAERQDPMAELIEMVGPEKIIIADVGEDRD